MKVLISGATQGLGEALVFEFAARYHEAHIVGFSRTLDKVNSLQSRIINETPDLTERVTIIQGDISSAQAVTSVLEKAEKILGGNIDVLVNNVGIFVFDEFLSPVPLEDCTQGLNHFLQQHSNSADLARKQKYFELVQTNFVGSSTLLDAVLNKARSPIKILDVGSIGVVAEMIGRPFDETSHYGFTKAKLLEHTLKAVKGGEHRLAAVHPGPFGRSAQEIANHFGDTWAVQTSEVAEHAVDLLAQTERDKIVQGIICAKEHFAWQYFGDIANLGLEGLTEQRCRRPEGKQLVRT